MNLDPFIRDDCTVVAVARTGSPWHDAQLTQPGTLLESSMTLPQIRGRVIRSWCRLDMPWIDVELETPGVVPA